MKSLKKIRVFMSMSIISIMTFTICAQANSPINSNTIKSFVIHDWYGDIIIYTDAPITNQEGCPVNNAVLVNATSPLYKEMYSALLATYYSSGKFSGWVNGCSKFGMPTLTRLDLNK
jgi:hypothetical protein